MQRNNLQEFTVSIIIKKRILLIRLHLKNLNKIKFNFAFGLEKEKERERGNKNKNKSLLATNSKCKKYNFTI